MTVPAPAVTHAPSPALRLHNPVLPVLFAVGAAGALGCGFLTLAPNRLVSGRPIGLFAADPQFAAAIAVAGMALLATAFLPPRTSMCRSVAVGAGVLLLLVLGAAGHDAAALAAAAPPVARVSLGAGFWLLLAAAALAIVDAVQRTDPSLPARLLIAAGLAAAVVLMAHAGWFDALSLAHEFRTHRDAFGAAMLRHLALVAAAVGLALVIAVPLGLAAARRPRWAAVLFPLLNLLQTIPSIALFGLLIAPLSALAAALPRLAAVGVGGIGVAPAIIALVLYALLPVARNTAAGIAGIDPAAVDAARGMGMSQRQVFWHVELPLGLPMLLAGLRIVTVQSIGLTVVAALIGAGGLGAFVFEGLGQDATDLVLLGALPAILLALAADLLLQALTAAAVSGLGR